MNKREVELDDDVWAECQKLRAAYGTINEILVAALAALRTQPAQVAEVSSPLRVPTADTTSFERPFKGELLKPSAKKKK